MAEVRLEALLNAPKLVEYVASDGGHASVMEQGDRDGKWVPVVKEAFAVADLGPETVPLLIDHLDDTRVTKATFRLTGDDTVAQPVALGFVCLDVLTSIVRDDPAVVVPECADDGMGACVQAGYYFRPDAFVIEDGVLKAGPTVKQVQANWRRALKNGHAKYALSRAPE